MENKKSFNLYCDIIHTVEKLSDEQSGKLFKHILRYVNDQTPITDDPLIDIVFEPIKQSLKRDLEKYLNIIERNKKNGSKGGRPKKNDNELNNPNNPVGFLETQNNPEKPKKADIDILLLHNNNHIGGWEKVIELFPSTKQNGVIEAAIVWNNLEQKDKQSVMRHLTPYIKNTDPKYIKQIGNYFNERLWETMKSKPSTNKIKMLDSNFIEWYQFEFDFKRFDEARTSLSSTQVNDPELFSNLEKTYKQSITIKN